MRNGSSLDEAAKVEGINVATYVNPVDSTFARNRRLDEQVDFAASIQEALVEAVSTLTADEAKCFYLNKVLGKSQTSIKDRADVRKSIGWVNGKVNDAIEKLRFGMKKHGQEWMDCVAFLGILVEAVRDQAESAIDGEPIATDQTA
ncbi:hypothetical protein RMSM_04433 [Rhodopirellula maiorica SM1]|uniref:Uncharacterized protein n=2 Tax=Novipirellula TaxID=2795426 RepID=M5RXH1_9BACT|nr:hypothetical protein RMSM_04433 [Rhodopirellula maiorica SM1]